MNIPNKKKKEFEISEKDWKETERRQQEVKTGKVKLIPARTVVKSITKKLKK